MCHVPLVRYNSLVVFFCIPFANTFVKLVFTQYISSASQKMKTYSSCDICSFKASVFCGPMLIWGSNLRVQSS